MRKGKISEEEKMIIKLMRDDGKSYLDIAKELNCKRDRVRDYCRVNQLSGHKAKYVTPQEREEQFAIAFNNKFPNFKYHSGFTSVDNYFISECKICGELRERSAQCTRREKVVECTNCIKQNQIKKQLIRKRDSEINKAEKDKERQNEKQQKQFIIDEAKRIERTSICEECGDVFTGASKGMKYCSIKCSSKRANRVKEINRRHRLKSNGDIDWSITLDKLMKRDKNVCHICKGKCNKKDYKIVDGNFVVGKEYPSIDHLTPVSKGGTHSWDNIKLAHHHCNTIKSNNDIYETSTRQMVMAI